MAETEPAVKPPELKDEDDIGTRLKAVRGMHGWSQRELAKRAGVTNASISLIEQNRVSPSIGSLKKILDTIPMSLAEFFTLRLDNSSQVFFRADELPDMGAGAIQHRLLGAGIQDRDMSVLKEVYPPGADTGPEMLSHTGEEGGIIIAGQLEVTVGAEVAILSAGDGYYFSSRRPHRFRNPGDTDCILVSANTPSV